MKPAVVSAYTPYIIGNGYTNSTNRISQIAAKPVARKLTSLSLSYGGDNVVALAEISKQLKDYNIGLMGASTSVYANRMGGFVGSVINYQAALMKYHQAVTSNSPMKTAIKEKANTAFKKMQTQFRNELRVVSWKIKSRRGIPLTSADRAINISKNSRNVAKLNVTSQVQANNLVQLSKQAKFLGNGLAVIDFGSRVGNVHNSYQSGKKWERDMFIESSSFAASAITGSLTVKAGLTLLVFATPFGWMGLVAGGLAVAAVSAGATIGMNSLVKENSGSTYDAIMKGLNH